MIPACDCPEAPANSCCSGVVAKSKAQAELMAHPSGSVPSSWARYAKSVPLASRVRRTSWKASRNGHDFTGHVTGAGGALWRRMGHSGGRTEGGLSGRQNFASGPTTGVPEPSVSHRRRHCVNASNHDLAPRFTTTLPTAHPPPTVAKPLWPSSSRGVGCSRPPSPDPPQLVAAIP